MDVTPRPGEIQGCVKDNVGFLNLKPVYTYY